MARRFVLLVVMVGAALLVCSAVAFAAVRTGTAGSETLAGTPDSDKITGRGGDDRTVGKAGNDTYFYADGWGNDTVVDSRGVDTLDFTAVTGEIIGSLCQMSPSSDPGFSAGTAGGVSFDSRIEGVRGGRGNDILFGCGGKNTIAGGAGEFFGSGQIPGDWLVDLDGMEMFERPASDDVYLGSKEGVAVVSDGGGTDVLNLGSLNSRSTRIVGEDLDNDGTVGSLTVYYGYQETLVGEMLLANQFEDDEFSNWFDVPLNFDGRIEKIKFKDKTVTVTPEIAAPFSGRDTPITERSSGDPSVEDLLP